MNFLSRIEIIDRFRQAMQSVDIVIDCEIVGDGVLRRFHVTGDSAGSTNGWYVLHLDGTPAGSFGCWKRGISERWCSGSYCNYVVGDARALQSAFAPDAVRNKRSDVLEDSQRLSETSLELWRKAQELNSNDHPYLRKKNVGAYGVRKYNEDLLIPVLTADGALVGLQKIQPNGSKRFVKGTQKSGNFHTITGNQDRVLLCEGYATGASLFEATADTVVIAFDSGNLLDVSRSIRAQYPNCKLILCADNDLASITGTNVGIEKAQAAAASVGAFLAAPQFPENAQGTDFNDLYQLAGKDAVLSVIESATTPTSNDENIEALLPLTAALEYIDRARTKYQLLTAKDLEELPAMNWRVKGIFPEKGVVAIYGQTGCGKSFLAMHLLAHVALGASWFNYKTKAVKCCYLGLEGESGLSKRLQALQQMYGTEASPMLCFGISPFHFADKKQIEGLAESLLDAGLDGGVVCVDTLAVASAGLDESFGKDMSIILQGANQLSKAINGLVVLVHHAGKDSSRGLRGHSSLKSNLDAVLHVQKSANEYSFSVEKSKDGIAGESHDFQLKIEDLGVDADGDTISSCVIVPGDVSKPAQTKLTPAQEKVLSSLANLVVDLDTLTLELLGLDALVPIKACTIKKWRDHAIANGIAGPDTKPEAATAAFQRAKKALQDEGLISIAGDRVWLTEKATSFVRSI